MGKDLNQYITKFKPLTTRMDTDYGLYILNEYVMTDPKTKLPLEHVENITLNDPKTFADAVLAILSGDKMKLEITKVSAKKQNDLEQFFRYLLEVNDDILSLQLIENFGSCVDWFSSLRGWVAARVLMLQDNNKSDLMSPEVMPIDPRWLKWEQGARGLDWGSYPVYMDIEQAKATFPDNGNLFTGNVPVQLEYLWDTKNFTIYPYDYDSAGKTWKINMGKTIKMKYGETLVDSIEHKLGMCPIVVLPAPTQPLLTTSAGTFGEALKYQGESIYSCNRNIYPQINKVASTWLTLNMQQFMSPMAFVGDRKFKQMPYGIGIVVELKKGEQLVEIPTKEMSQSAQNLFGQLFSDAQRGSMSNVDYGQTPFELSALAIAQLKDSRDKVFAPRRKVKAALMKRIFTMLREQVMKDSCYKTTVVEEDALIIDEKNPLKSLFADKFNMKISFNSISPEENIANYQLAQMAQQIGISPETILRDIIHSDDPKGELAASGMKIVYDMCPELRMYDAAIHESKGTLSDDQIAEDRAQIIMWKLEQIKQGSMQIPSIPGVASQPKQTIGMNRNSSEKIAAAKRKEAGTLNASKAISAKRTGG